MPTMLFIFSSIPKNKKIYFFIGINFFVLYDNIVIIFFIARFCYLMCYFKKKD